MAKVILSRLAQSDEVDIARDLTRKAGYRVAAQYAARFERLYDRLGRFPESGAPRPKIGTRVRIGVVKPFTVPHRYDPATDTVIILRIVHGRRRLTGAMLFSSNEA